MRNKLKKLGVTLAVFLSVTNVYAEWSGNLTISHIYGGENITVYFNEPIPNPAECSQAPLKAIAWEGSNPGAKNFMSMMLAAKMAKEPVQVSVRSDGCLWGGWPKLDVMKLM